MTSANVDTVLAYLRAGLRGDYEACLPLIGEGYNCIDRARGIHASSEDELIELMQEDTSWSDREFCLENVMETTDGTVIVQATVTGTHAGTWRSIPATGKRVTFSFCSLFKFDSQGRIVSEEQYEDHLSVFTALGAVQPR